MEPEPEALIRLNLTRKISSRGARRLRDTFGSLERAIAASEERLAAVRGVGPEAARLLKEQAPDAAQTEVARAERIGARIVCAGDAAYPARLAAIVDPPLVLYVRGALPVEEAAVAVVGARGASAYGLRTAGLVANGLAGAGVAVVSGLARGVDAAAHRGALAAKGRTVAVLGSGLDQIYPREHAALAEEIVRAGGALVSEFPLGTPPLAFHFPRRNRIVSGLSLGVLVVEAAEKSGSLITAEWALEQGREVLAVPGRVDEPGAAGCHRLIQEGAALVTCAADVLAACGLAPSEKRPTARTLFETEAQLQGLTPEEERVLAAVTDEPIPIDDIAEGTGLPVSTIFAALSALEMRRAVKAWPGKNYQRAR